MTTTGFLVQSGMRLGAYDLALAPIDFDTFALSI